jgi:hypothetical protein
MKRWLLCLALCGCQSPPTQTAVLLAPSPEINAAVASLLHSDQVTLAQDAFMHESEIFLGRSKQMLILEGKSKEKPEIFKLSLVGKNCYLERVNTGEKRQLKEAQCKAK